MRCFRTFVLVPLCLAITGCGTVSDGSAAWESLLDGEGIDDWKSGAPCFKRQGQTITGEDGGWGDRLAKGSPDWRDYEFAVDVTPIKGPLIQIHYRISAGGKRWYTLDLRPEAQEATISAADQRDGRNDFGPVITKPMKIKYGTEYALRVTVRGAKVTAYVNNEMIGTFTDLQAPSGSIGLGLFASKAEFRNPRIRHL